MIVEMIKKAVLGAAIGFATTAFGEPSDGEVVYHTVKVPKMAAGVFVPVVVNLTAAGDFIVGNIAPAEASALKIENGEVKLTVEVDASTDLKTWTPAKTVEIDIPAEGEKGFYILKSK